MIRVGIVAPSSVVPKIELELGIEFLQARGFEVMVHPTVWGEYNFYPAPDEERAEALIEYAQDPNIDVIWCARGGYGATHLLPLLNRVKKKIKAKKLKKKTLIGYSDVTALHEWFRVNLGWTTLHAPMPSSRTFSFLREEEWNGLRDLIDYSVQKGKIEKYSHTLQPIFVPKGFKGCKASVVGGNLAVWNSLIGTPDVGNARGKILFFEEIGENSGRINRMMHHLEQSGGLKGVKGIVLGDFTDCPDSVPNMLSKLPPLAPDMLEPFLRDPPRDLVRPLRTIYSTDETLEIIFTEFGQRLKIPVFKGIPAGHGPHFHSLILGHAHKLNKNGEFSLA